MCPWTVYLDSLDRHLSSILTPILGPVYPTSSSLLPSTSRGTVRMCTYLCVSTHFDLLGKVLVVGFQFVLPFQSLGGNRPFDPYRRILIGCSPTL